MTNAVAVRPEARHADPEAVQHALARPDRAQMLADLLGGSGITTERFAAVVLNTMVRNPDLQRASLESVLDAIRVSATLRLEPTGILGEGYILRYGDKAQFEAGYRGLMKLARRSGMVDSMDAQVVYMADTFAIQLGTDPRIEHVPLTEGDRGGYRGAYAWARLSTGELVIEWMSDADVQAVRKVSRNGSGASSPWVAHYGEMARKTVIKRLMKRLPLGADAETALRLEAEADAQEAPSRPRPAIAAIHARLGIPAGPDEPPSAPVAMGEVEPASGSAAPSPDDAVALGATAPAGSVAEHGTVMDTGPAPAQCGSMSPYDQPTRCQREAGHPGTHRNQDRETWL